MRMLSIVGSAVAVTALLLAATTTDAECLDTVMNNIQPNTSTIEDLFLTQVSNDEYTQIKLNIPPRYMWGWGPGLSGYCGSFSTQSIGLYYGLWLSGEQLRYAAQDGDTQVLVGSGSYQSIAAEFNLDITEWDYNVDNPQISDYLNWIYGHISNGHPVIVGVFENEKGGDPDYDHIVPVFGVKILRVPNAQLPNMADGNTPSNVTEVYFNDLWSNNSRVFEGTTLAVHRKSFETFAPPVQPYEYAFPTTVNYGVAIRGLQDPLGETYRVKLTAWSWTEPDYGNEDGCHMQPAMLDLSITVYGLTPDQGYTILRFDGNTSSGRNPSQNFASSNLATAVWTFTARSTQHTITQFDSIMSNTTATYRAVAGRAVPSVTMSRTKELPTPKSTSTGAAPTATTVSTTSAATATTVTTLPAPTSTTPAATSVTTPTQAPATSTTTQLLTTGAPSAVTTIAPPPPTVTSATSAAPTPTPSESTNNHHHDIQHNAPSADSDDGPIPRRDLPIVIGVAAGVIALASIAIGFVARRYFTSRHNRCKRHGDDAAPLNVAVETGHYGVMRSPRCADEVALLAETVIPATSGKQTA
jgi:hypothetical protein